MKRYEQKLTGGHPNSLGNTIEVVEEVLADPGSFEALFNCYFSEDEVIRLRVSNAMKRLCKANRMLLLPYMDRFLNEISKIDQASAQWTLSQLFLLLQRDLTAVQKEQALEIMKQNLVSTNDWIVLNMTMETLGKWALKNDELSSWLIPHLNRLIKDERKSVSKKANKTLHLLQK